jgi:hypothetical protein
MPCIAYNTQLGADFRQIRQTSDKEKAREKNLITHEWEKIVDVPLRKIVPILFP